MPFSIIGRTGPGIRQVVRFGDRSTGRNTFGCELGARQCNQLGLSVYVCDSAATRPSSQITLGKLVRFRTQVTNTLTTTNYANVYDSMTYKMASATTDHIE